MAITTVLVLGCGLAGVAAAREIKRRLGKDGRVVVVDREPIASYSPAYVWVMTGDRRASAITRQRARLARHGLETIIAEVREVDMANRIVRTDSRELRYDFLVVAIGAEVGVDNPPGLTEAALGLVSLEGVEHLAAALRYFTEGRISVAVTGTPSMGPGIPYEVAMLVEQHFHSRRMRQKVRVDVFTPEPRPLSFASNAISEQVRGLLAHKGIGLHTRHELGAVHGRAKSMSFADGTEIGFDLLVAMPRYQAPRLAYEAGLVDESGWIPVQPDTLETSTEGVFALGDVATFGGNNGAHRPRSEFVAEQQGGAVARQIEARIRGAKAAVPYDQSDRFFIEVGGGAAARVHGILEEEGRGLEMNQPSIVWHWARRAIERNWLWRTY